MATIKLRNITKRFEDEIAVRNLSLKIDDGEFAVILGPSGCGKTTTLRIIAGLTDPTEGEVLIDDENVSDVPPSERNIAMIFQESTVYPHMDVFENIATPLELRGVPEDEISDRVKETAELMEIGNFLERNVTELSGGQRQRVAICKAIIREPTLFLMDEPLSDLDAKLRKNMRKEIKRIQRKLNVTTIYVTHNQEEAMTLGDKIAVLRDGKLQVVGSPDEVYSEPNNKFVGGFVGSPSMNFLEGKVIQESGEIDKIETEFFDYSPAPNVVERISGPTVDVGIRPENITAKEGGKQGDSTGRVVVTENLGSQQQLTIQKNDNSLIVVNRGKKQFTYGDEVSLEMDKDAVMIFDKESGKNLSLTEQ